MFLISFDFFLPLLVSTIYIYIYCINSHSKGKNKTSKNWTVEKFESTSLLPTLLIRLIPMSITERKAHLCPDAVAMGDGPLGGRGSSQVLISITTLSKV